MLRYLQAVAAALASTGTAACTNSHVVVTSSPAPPRAEAGVRDQTPRERDPEFAADFLEQSVLRPARSLFNSPGLVRRLLGGSVEAYNVTSEDDVGSSGWFTHRNGRHRMTPRAVGQAPHQREGPENGGLWTVIAVDVTGDGPRLTVRDTTGEQYTLRFDAPAYPELATAAEVISARLFYAAGYHTAEFTITVFDPMTIRAAKTLWVRDQLGRRHPVTTDDLQELLRHVARRTDGRIRAVARRVLQRTIGPFSFHGRRRDDPLDTIPHQHRRELRGLYVLAAWLNHVHINQRTTMDAFTDEDHGGGVRHYLIDFRSSLGSAGRRPSAPRDGQESDLDVGRIGFRLITAGFYAAPWERTDLTITYPSVGYYSDQSFDPSGWAGNYPNPAFSQGTVRDAYWGAKLVARFSERQIRAAVSAGELTDPAAAEALVQAMLGRRRLTVRHWFRRVTPLEELAIRGGSEGPVLTFRDLAVAEGMTRSRQRRYRMRFEFPALHLRVDEVRGLGPSEDGRGELELPSVDEAGWTTLSRESMERRIAKLELRATPDAGEPKPRSIRIYLLADRIAGYRVVGRAY